MLRLAQVVVSPIEGARVVAVPSSSPVPPQPQEHTSRADGTFALLVEPHRLCWVLAVGPDGTSTIAGMVNSDLATATQFSVEILSAVNAGDIVLSSP